MQYKYEVEARDDSDLASGRVFYSLPGHPAFPIRLASEIFQRCMAQREMIYQRSDPCTLFDPCCGAAYHLSVLGTLHGKHIKEIIASDIDPKAVDMAKRNLGLLSTAGIDQRIHEINRMIEQYGKDSHKDALKSASLLRDKIATADQEHPIRSRVFQSSATDKTTIRNNIQSGSVDVVFTDVPYGQHSEWRDADGLPNPLWSMLDAIRETLSASNIVAVASDKVQKVSHEAYQRVEQFQLGKRRIVILRLI